jgi:heterodisulfide reductase subunit A2
MSRIGVFVCHCGENIARTVDCARVAKESGRLPGVMVSLDYKYMCSDPGQNMIKDAIQEQKLDGVVVAACSPHMHEPTFRTAVAEAGLNPFLCEMANIREHCSWVHQDAEESTEKAIDLVRVMVEKVKRNQELFPIKVPITKRALVIGGGIAGIQAALDIAAGGHEVVLVERLPSIGGNMARLSETFPTLDCSQCILTPRMVEVARDPRITLYTYAEVEEIEGFVGNFKVKIRQKAKSVRADLCNGCGDCWNKCPVKKIPSEFDAGLGNRTAIYVPFPQAVPNTPVIDREHCLKFLKDKCGVCAKLCTRQAIDYEMQDEIIEAEVGAIVVATGYDLYGIGREQPNERWKGYGEYNYDAYKDIINGMQFERLLSASGPTQGEVRRPSDGKVPKSVVFIACVGSRDPEKGLEYCSKICCMYIAKHAMLYKHKVHDGQPYVFYMDIRAGGKNYEEFVRRAVEEDGVLYIRGRVSKIYRDGEQLVVVGADTLSDSQVEVRADLVVLATAMVPHRNAYEFAQRIGIGCGSEGFYAEAHPKLRPVETMTAGVYLAGACQAPKDIPEAVAQASAAASKVQLLFSSNELEREPIVAKVNEATCVHCRNCIRVCPYSAIDDKEIRDKQGNLVKMVAEVNEGMCMGCGTCVAVCPSKSVQLAGFNDEQVFAEILALGHG